MEQVGEEAGVVNDIAGGIEFQGKECNLALEAGRDSVSASPVLCQSMRSGNWPEGYSSGQDLNRCVLSVAGSELPHTSPYSVRKGGNVVEELTTQNCWSLNHALAGNVDANKGGLSGAAMPSSDLPLKTLGASSLSPMLVKRVVKGKGVVNRNQESVTEFGGALGGQVDENMAYARKVASNALIRSSARDNIARWIDRSSPESSHRPISLREWLKPGSKRKEKAGSISIFKQIVELVDLAHSQGLALEDLRPSCFNLLPSNKVVYVSSPAQRQPEPLTFRDSSRKRQLEQDEETSSSVLVKQQKLGEDTISLRRQLHFESNLDIRNSGSYTTHHRDLRGVELPCKNHSNSQSSSMTTRQQHNSLIGQLEQKWYKSPEQLNGGCASFSSNIYSLGVLLFELLSWFESSHIHFSAMADLQKRILPPKFLSENYREAGFCLWLLHPTSSSRPTAREILQSELTCQSPELCYGNISKSSDNVDAESAMLLHFLNVIKEQKQKHASKLVKDIECLEEDIKEVEKRHLTTSADVLKTQEKILDAVEKHHGTSMGSVSRLFSSLTTNEVTLKRNIKKIENAYFSIRSQIHVSSSATRVDKGLLKNRDICYPLQNENSRSSISQKSVDPVGVFFEGLCKFAQYHKLEVCGSLKNRDLLGGTNVVCSLSFDRDEDYIAAAGVSKKIKVFEFETLLSDSVDVHYPVVELSNKSKLSCLCWNNYIKNYLASTDYDGVVQMWDAGTGQGFSQYREHQKRAWSVDFSLADPMMFASGSDDCSVKLWSLNERNSIGTIWSPANVCSVQFSASSNNFLVFGSADYKIYCYDLRHTRIPWCTLGGHEKAVSYMKFLDSETLVSASTDNSLKLWDLNKTSSNGLSTNACTMTFSGHTNEKNFVGLSALDGYIACGSETNEVYCYYKSLPMPVTSHKFSYVDLISGKEMGDDNGQFVSSVCWRQKSKIVVAANSSGDMKLLQLV